MKPARLAQSLALLAIVVGSAQAELPPAEIGGLLLSRTFTVAGADFAREFADKWRELDRAGSFSLILSEKPEPRGGSRVWIELDGEAIAVVGLSPGKAAPAQTASEVAYARAVERSLSPARHRLESPTEPETAIE